MAESEPNEDEPAEPTPAQTESAPASTEPTPGPEESAPAPIFPSNATENADGTDPADTSEPSDATDTSGDSGGTLDLSRSKLAVAPAAADEEAEDAEPAAEEAPIDMAALRRTVEALLFAAEAPLSVREIARAASSRSNTIRKVLKELKESLDADQRPWELVEVAGGWRFATRPEYFPAVQKLKVQRAQRRLTPAAMEVLALIAYSQEPIGRAEIEAVRGVDSGPVLRQLLDRKLIRIAGRGEGLGQPLLYAVSQEFLVHFGLKSARDLPQPGEFKGA